MRFQMQLYEYVNKGEYFINYSKCNTKIPYES